MANFLGCILRSDVYESVIECAVSLVLFVKCYRRGWWGLARVLCLILCLIVAVFACSMEIC